MKINEMSNEVYAKSQTNNTKFDEEAAYSDTLCKQLGLYIVHAARN
jgi:hypothetical protein